MLGFMLAAQMKQPSQSTQLRVWSVAVLMIFAAVWIIFRPDSVPKSLEVASWTLFLCSVIVGGSLTGWRITQFTKTRAAEFHLVAPLSDWTLVLGELLGGSLQALYAIGATLPIVAAMYGAGWMDFAQAFGMITIPIAFGWLVGIGLAAVAYSPSWLRKLGERISLVLLIAYFVLFGIFGQQFAPWFFGWLSRATQTPMTAWSQFDQTTRYLNPFRLVGAIGRESGIEFFLQVLVVFAMLVGLCALGTWYLVHRLRKHYLEENYSNKNRERKFSRSVKANPLSWWTHRRVSQFRGRTNIYLGWGTVILFSIWFVASIQQGTPMKWGSHLILVFMYFGGAAMIGTFALQFALVSAAFLNGLWDSNSQQRVGRLELLLVSPLTVWEFLGGSIAAVWTRGKHYLAMAVVVWAVAAAVGWISWAAYFFALLVAAVYVFFVFAIAFRNFARLKGDHQVATYGLMISVGIPLVTCALFVAKLGVLGALTPLGAIFLLTSKASGAAARTGLDWGWMWLLILLSSAVYFGIAVRLTRAAFENFDREIREWFSLHLVSPEARKKVARGKLATKPSDVSSQTDEALA